MTLLWLDGFEGFPDGGDEDDLGQVYNFDATATAGITTPGRAGGRYAFVTENSSQTDYIEIPLAGLGSSSDTWILGMGYRAQLASYDPGAYVLQFLDIDSNPMLTVNVNASALSVRRGGTAGTVLGVPAFSFVTTIWYFLEIKVKFHASTGTVDMQIHEQDVLSLTSQNTTDTGNTQPYAIRIASQNIHHANIDDLYICDGVDATGTQGDTYNDFLGDNLIEKLTPNANGNTNDYTGSDADSTDNYLLVDDPDPDDDTTYVETSTVNEKDLYGFSAISTTPVAIPAIALKSYAKKTDGGSREFQHVIRSGTTEDNSATLAPSTSYSHLQSIYTQDPDTSAAWTEAGVNAVEGGTELTA